MSQLLNLEKMLNTLGVEDCSQPAPVDTELLDLVKAELDSWVADQMGDKPYIFGLIMPNTENIPKKFDDVEMFSFGIFSKELWSLLVSEKDNPVFELLRYFSDNIEYLDLLKSKYGVDKLAPDIPIYDRFGLDYYKYIYGTVKEVLNND